MLSTQLSTGLTDLGISLTTAQQQQLLDYIALLHRWNQKHNLSGIHILEQMVTHHLLDSLSILPYMSGTRWADVGSGAGLPGIPLAIARPDVEITLIEPRSKRVDFLYYAATHLGIGRILIVQGKSEDLHAEVGYDTVVTRAFADLNTAVQKTKHLWAAKGCLVAMKGQLDPNELLVDTQQYCLRTEALHVPGLNKQRHAVIVTQNG
ncbi:MAG: 16S rRNA (guanine(527)-N(7))-methyltransferase RsmG [Pseudomonadota bacterium]